MLVGADDHRSTHWFRYPPILELPTNICQNGIFMDHLRKCGSLYIMDHLRKCGPKIFGRCGREELVGLIKIGQ